MRWVPILCVYAIVLSNSINGATASEAMRIPDAAALYKRVLTLTGARLHRKTDSRFVPIGDKDLPVFTPYYVYDEKQLSGDAWVYVGKKAKDSAEGWLAGKSVEEWNNQLVMTYMPRGRRERVLYFDSLDALLGITHELVGTAKVKAMLTRIETGKGTPPGIIAIEPWEYIDYIHSPYLMPIFSHRKDSIRGGGKTTLLEVALLNLEHADPDINEKLAPLVATAPELKDFKVGIVFVMDTTASMGPYIDRTYQVVKSIYKSLEASGDIDRVSFGLVGYRDSIEPDVRIEYVTRVFQPLDSTASPRTTLENLQKVKPASVTTKDWYEDAYAGIRTAIQTMDWTPFDARFVVLVSDAGPRRAAKCRPGEAPKCRPGDVPTKANCKRDSKCDKLASLTSGELVALRGEIDRKRIAVITLHLLTPEGAKYKDHQSARTGYTKGIGQTGDKAQDKYLGIRGGSVEEFTSQIQAFARQLQGAVSQAAQGKVVERTEPAKGPSVKADMGGILVNEIFRAQTEYIGKKHGTEAPRLYRAWTADRDLSQPAVQTLDKRVLLTKDQLNTLAARLSEIIPALKAGALDPQEGWSQLVSLSGRFATDPSRRKFVEVGDSGLLPDYLKQLPYKSEMLGMTFDHWKGLGGTGQQTLIRQMEDRLDVYQSLAQDDRIWIDLGAGDPNLRVYPVSLEDLP